MSVLELVGKENHQESVIIISHWNITQFWERECIFCFVFYFHFSLAWFFCVRLAENFQRSRVIDKFATEIIASITIILNHQYN